ncbi:MAG TPA: histidine--tRNA ligase [Candidatus Nanoarchaeia archaeon]|nr:histidine--tRNA ligase [Candidatus Nanoarchaeia archaeon]
MELQLAKGVRDVPPEEKIVVNRILDTLKETFERYGFVPLETPLLERWETLTAKGGAGEESDVLKETFKLKDQGNRELALRFDLTVPLARYVAMNSQLKLPFKRYEMGPVFRDGPLKLGRYRQFWQCDIDTIGVKGMLAEAEQLALVQDAFQSLGIDIIIKVNNRKLLNGILEQCGIQEKESAIIAIDKLEKLGAKGVAEELSQRGYSETPAKKLLGLLKEKIALKELKKKIKSDEAKQGLQELEDLFGYLKNLKVKCAEFEASLARGLGYYTGTVFEVFALNSPVTSSIAGGGRYDQMVGKFAGGSREIPAVGIAFGLSTILDVLKAKQEFKEKSLAKVFVIPIQTIKESLKVVQQLRKRGINVDMDLNNRGVGKNLEYASALGIPYCIILGGDELKKNKVLLRDMLSGDQFLLTLKEVIKKIKLK